MYDELLKNIVFCNFIVTWLIMNVKLNSFVKFHSHIGINLFKYYLFVNEHTFRLTEIETFIEPYLY